jgi:hypothetical protein
MSNMGLLLAYKLKSFFGPSYRGKYGPLPLIVLSLLFLPSGVSMGYFMGELLAGSDSTYAVNLLGSALSAMMVFGFVFALGVGVTAQPSELDFIMTSPIRPREYLIADLLFQFGSITIAGGMAILMAVFGFLWGSGESLFLAAPILLLVGAYSVMVFMIIQSLTVLRIRYPESPVRLVVILLLLLSVVPVASVASSDFPVNFGDLPIPQSAFAGMLNAFISGSGVELIDAAVAAGYLFAVFVLWAKVSGMYFFHGVKPTLSAGFGQVDMSSKMAQQKKMISGFGRLTTKINLRTDSGSDLSLMTRLSLIRFWRDGSFVFVALLIAVFLATGIMQTSSDESAPIVINLFQAGAWPIAILALNWCYYERENLWIPVVGGRSLETYFRGLMMALVVVGIGITGLIIGALFIAGVILSPPDTALMVSTPIAVAAIATIMLTRIRVKPGAFSPGMLAVLFGAIMAGAAIGGAVWAVVSVIGDSTLIAVVAQLVATVVLSIVICVIGLIAVSRLARGFRFA